MSPKRVTRRQMLQSGTLLALPAVWHGTRPPAAQAAPAAATGLRVGSRMYESIGVRPIINGRGTYTILSGSLMLPEVRAAMDEAAQHYVHLDELAEGIGARLASRGTHRLFLRQKEHALDGSHRGDFVERALTGTIDGADVEIRSTQTEREDGNSLRYTFTGTVAGDTMSGSLDMGEYLDGRWTARRRTHES